MSRLRQASRAAATNVYAGHPIWSEESPTLVAGQWRMS